MEKTELINYSKDNNDNKESSFAYYFTNEYIIWIFSKKNNEIENKELFEKIFSLLINKFIQINKYSLKTLKILNDEIKKELEIIKEELNILNDLKLSISIIISDYNSLIFSYFSNLRLSIIRNDKLIFQTLDCKSEDLFIINEPFFLEQGDHIIINSENINELFNVLNLENIESNDSYLLNKITFNELNINSIYVNNDKRNKKILIIIALFFILIYIFSNIYIVKKTFKYNLELEKSFSIYLKSNDLKNMISNIDKQIKNLQRLNKKYIYLNKKNLIEKEKKLIEKEKINENLTDLKKIFDKIEFIKEDIYKRNFKQALNEYLKINENIKNFSDEFIYYKSKIENDIKKLEHLSLIQIEDIKVSLDEKEIIKNFKIINELINNYKNSNFNIYIEDLIKINEDYLKKFNNLENSLNERILNIELLKRENLIKAKKECEYLIEILTYMEDENLIFKIKEILSDIEKEIEYYKEELKKSYNNAIIEYENKNYNLSLNFLDTAKTSAKILDNDEKIKEINGRIRHIKKYINKEKSKNLKDYSKEIKNSIKLSIIQGDEYLKNDEFEKAYREYKRVLEMSKEIEINKKMLEDVNRKINFIKSKVNKNGGSYGNNKLLWEN